MNKENNGAKLLSEFASLPNALHSDNFEVDYSNLSSIFDFVTENDCRTFRLSTIDCTHWLDNLALRIISSADTVAVAAQLATYFGKSRSADRKVTLIVKRLSERGELALATQYSCAVAILKIHSCAKNSEVGVIEWDLKILDVHDVTAKLRTKTKDNT